MTNDLDGGPVRRVATTLLDPTFSAMWLAMFFSSVGSSTLLLAIAIQIYLDTRSALDASLIYAAQWLAPIVLAPLVIGIFGVLSPKAALVGCETIGIGLAAGIGWLVPHGLVLLLPLLVLRGIVDVTVKSGRMVALKACFSGDRLKSAMSLNSTPYILGLASAGLLASVLVGRLEIWSIALVAAACSGIAALLYGTLHGGAAAAPEPSAVATRPALRNIRTAFDADRPLARRFALYLLVVATMQGYHTIARTVFPIERLGLETSGPAWLQTAAIGGVFAGAVLAAACVGLRRYEATRVELIAILGYGLMLATWMPASPVMAMGLYFLFMLVYEIAFVRLTGEIMAACRQEHAPSLSVAMTTGSLGGMTMVTLAGGWAATALGLSWVCIGIAATGTAAVVAGLAGGPLRRPEPVPEAE